MAAVVLMPKPGGILVPADEQSAIAIAKWKPGEGVEATVKRIRSLGMHRRWFALLQIGYDAFCEGRGGHEYRGDRVLPDFDRYRRDVTILAGFYRPVYSLTSGGMSLEAESISFANMDEDRFRMLFDRTITVLLEKVLPRGRYTAEQLAELADQVVGFV